MSLKNKLLAILSESIMTKKQLGADNLKIDYYEDNLTCKVSITNISCIDMKYVCIVYYVYDSNGYNYQFSEVIELDSVET